MAGSDIKSGHLHSSGYIFKGRARVKAIDVVGSASAGLMEIWDTDVPPTTAAYNRTGTTVTVDSVAHGLATGDVIGIAFEPDAGVIATPGNYPITVVDADSFTITDINSGTIANDPECRYVYSFSDELPAEWKATYHTSATDIYINGFNIPEEGLLCRKGIYIFSENLVSINIFYG